jgi:general secretion pathway protein B
MSFILDALKKSESDRQRQSGPALYEVKVAAPRSQLPYWAIGLIGLLAINLIIVAWALLRRPSHEPDTPVVAASNAPAPAAAPAAAPAPESSHSSTAYTPPPQVSPQAPPAAPPSQAPSTFIAGGQEPPTRRSAPTSPAAYSDLPPEEDSTGASNRPANAQAAPRAAQGTSGEANSNPDDYAPATEPSKAPSLGFHVTRGTAEGVPLYSQVSSGAGIPELRLDLHAYDANPQKRFVLINMKKEREGDMLPDGTTRVDTITQDGVVLDHEGTKFLLPRP